MHGVRRCTVCVCNTCLCRQMFRGVLVWGKAQLSAADCSSMERLADVVSSLLDHIRFPNMTLKEQGEAVKSGCVRV